jgi:predicted nucleic acid-binding protein
VILADTSVWIDFFRRGEASFAARLAKRQVAVHPFVAGELACGQVPLRAQTLADLRTLPAVGTAADHEVLHLIELHRLHGSGLGWTDVHLLAAALLAGMPLVTQDRRLAAAARALGAGG